MEVGMYEGYLLKVGINVIPFEYMRADTYKATYNGQDIDSYRDADGLLHRNALPHFVPKVEFNTPHITNVQAQALLGLIRSQYLDTVEKKVSVKCYIPELDDYLTQDMYIPDIEFQIFKADGNDIIYNETRIAFIGY